MSMAKDIKDIDLLDAYLDFRAARDKLVNDMKDRNYEQVDTFCGIPVFVKKSNPEVDVCLGDQFNTKLPHKEIRKRLERVPALMRNISERMVEIEKYLNTLTYCVPHVLYEYDIDHDIDHDKMGDGCGVNACAPPPKPRCDDPYPPNKQPNF